MLCKPGGLVTIVAASVGFLVVVCCLVCLAVGGCSKASVCGDAAFLYLWAPAIKLPCFWF